MSGLIKCQVIDPIRKSINYPILRESHHESSYFNVEIIFIKIRNGAMWGPLAPQE